MKTILSACGLLAAFIVSADHFANANPADTDANNQYSPRAVLDGDRAFQDCAPEYLEIKVLKVNVAARNGMFHQGQSLVKIQATVTQVYRSNAGLKPGQTILIHYERKNSVGFGDIQPTVPAEGAVTAAFLRKAPDKDTFAPAARQYTFLPLSPAQMEALNPRKNSVKSNADTTAADTADVPADETQPQAENSGTAAETPLPAR